MSKDYTVMSKDYRERYKNIAQSDWFKEHYENASTNVVAEEPQYQNGSLEKFLLNKLKEIEDELDKLETEIKKM